MSESADSGAGRREVAYRLFATEFDDADFSYSESDEERAPNYVITPTGARINRLFVVGVLTEIEQVNEEVLRARVVDPTGPFVIYAGQYQPDELAFLEAAEPPLFVAVTGKARTFQPDDSDRVFTSVRPESISQVDADTRDRWIVQAAEQTLTRIGQMASAKQTGLAGSDLRNALRDQGVDESAASGIALALDHYGTTGDYLQALRETALDAARVVAGETDEADTLSMSPGDGSDDPIPVLAATEFDTDTVTSDAESQESEGVAGGETAATDSATDTSTTDSDTTSETASAGDTDTGEAVVEAGTTGSAVEADNTGSAVSSDAPDGAIASDADEAKDESDGTEAVTTASAEPDSEPATSTSDTTESDSSEVQSGSEETDRPEETDGPAETDSELGEFEPEFELDEEEREEIEQEYGTDFQTGSEVEEPGEADIETPDPDAVDESAPGDAADATTTDEPSETAGSGAEAGTDDVVSETESTTAAGEADSTANDAEPESPSAEDVDLEDAVMEVMSELDDGSGADRDELVSTVSNRYDADTAAIDDAIQDALMGGRCYEPADGKLTPI